MKNIASLLTLIIIALCSFNVAKADNCPSEKGPQIVKEASYFVDKLDLRGDTAVTFTKIYTDYRSEMEAVHRDMKPNNGKKGVLTDKEADENIRNGFNVGRKMIDIREKYYSQFRTILSPVKIQKMYRYERSVVDAKRKEMAKRNAMAKRKENHQKQMDNKKKDYAKRRAERQKTVQNNKKND